MTAAVANFTLEIEFIGMTLWMDRAGYYDVLIPDDELTPGDEYHHVLSITASKQIDLNGIFLDFSLLRPFPEKPASYTPSGFLPVRVSRDSPAADANTVVKGTGLIGGVRLPYGKFIDPAPRLIGPFSYDGHTNLELSSTTKWRCVFGADVDIDCVMTRYADQVKTILSLGRLCSETPNLRLKVSALSIADQTQTKELNVGDTLPEVAALHALTSGAFLPSRTAPVLEDAPVPPGGYKSSGFPIQTANHLCPNGKGTIV